MEVFPNSQTRPYLYHHLVDTIPCYNFQMFLALPRAKNYFEIVAGGRIILIRTHKSVIIFLIRRTTSSRMACSICVGSLFGLSVIRLMCDPYIGSLSPYGQFDSI